ncbi:MAG: anaerobic ribonucleoside-triphosphate reductase [Clostridia bacterium]|nr:anaerobic ribonucleoside-triphosphate reductase [Clostridia bacterium]
MALAQSLGLPCKMYITTYSSHKDDVRYRIEFGVNEKLYSHMASEKKRVMKVIDDKECVVSANIMTPDVCEIVSIERIDIDEYSYDVETTSDRFDVSGILSHNCRTRVISNVNGPEVVTSRGNLSFTSINLPRLAIMGALYDPHNGIHTAVETFFELLDEMMNNAIDQLMHRFRIQCQRKVKNHPFLMGQGVWMDSEKLSPDDTLEEVLKHGSLSVGFIGLAEALKVLTGYHHGESKEAWDLGYKIIKHMRDRMDEEAEKTKLNFSLLATPAEGLSGRFVKIDAERFGKIPGVTDRDYYSNSFHIPVYHEISAFEKIKLEAPFHELTNAGHISYIELDGDATANLGAFEKIVRCMKDQGIGYGAINHPVDRDPVCGYTGIIYDECPQCGRKERDSEIGFERIRRITGYLVGTMDRWNNAKAAEERDRVKHNT